MEDGSACGRVANFVATPPGAEDVIDDAIRWVEAGRGVALATVLATWGSAPRPAGSQLAVNDRMEFVGSVSGGCVEGATVREAVDVIAEERPRTLAFGVSSNDTFGVGLACGGEIRLFVEPVTRDVALLRKLVEVRETHRSVVVATSLESGRRAIIPASGDLSAPGVVDALVRKARDAAARDASTVVDCDGTWFLHVRHPPRRLLVVGAVHVAQVLAPMAALNGFDVQLIDPRDAFATRERFPGVRICHSWPRDALEMLGVDHRTAVVTLAHDPKIDDPALELAVRSPAFYVGALGSRRTHALRLQRLAERGFTADELHRIRGPVGLPIGAVTIAEIATSIVADVIRSLRRPP
jgi:xanthine dehydrogenase accessory factor